VSIHLQSFVNSFLSLVPGFIYLKQQSLLFVCVRLFNDTFVCRFHDTGYSFLVGWFCIVLNRYFVTMVLLKRLYKQICSKFRVLLKKILFSKISLFGWMDSGHIKIFGLPISLIICTFSPLLKNCVKMHILRDALSI
jgi:hypothetical protein